MLLVAVAVLLFEEISLNYIQSVLHRILEGQPESLAAVCVVEA